MLDSADPASLSADMPAHDAARHEVMIVSGEASGDMYGAALVRAMQALDPTVRFYGMGGPELKAAGLEGLYDASRLAVVGVIEVISHLRDIMQARRLLVERMRERRPSLLILVDYPDFNLSLAAQAKKLGIPVLYYISPQIWAWRKGRVHTIGRLTDCVAVILPFEEEIYLRHGYEARFVGHPLLDTVTPRLSRQQFLSQQQIVQDSLVIGLIPGSRAKEVKSLLPLFLAAAELYLQKKPAKPVVFLIPQASTISRELLDAEGLANWQGRIDFRVIQDDRYSMMAACDAVLAASGTVTLELALLKTPTVVAYKVSPLTYWLAKIIIRTLPYFSLPNLIAGRTIIPELLQTEVTPERLSDELSCLLTEPIVRQTMQEDMANIRQKLGESGAAIRTAQLALSMLSPPHG